MFTGRPHAEAGAAAEAVADEADLERRFGGLRRLYCSAGYSRLRAARIAVVGLGGVGSWAVEALARSGVAELVLVDLDQVAESNINRQVQATGATVGMSKAEALRARIADIHPGCIVHGVEEFADETNWPALLPVDVDGLIDACDQGRAKLALAAWARGHDIAFVACGAAGGKRHPHKLEVDDLSAATHDPLLASLRQRLRARHGAPRAGRLGVRCVFSREGVTLPELACEPGQPGQPGEGAAATDGTLNCHGYGSTVTVTASFGLAAAAEVVEQLLSRRERGG